MIDDQYYWEKSGTLDWKDIGALAETPDFG
jgi:hypothetical protein